MDVGLQERVKLANKYEAGIVKKVKELHFDYLVSKLSDDSDQETNSILNDIIKLVNKHNNIDFGEDINSLVSQSEDDIFDTFLNDYLNNLV